MTAETPRSNWMSPPEMTDEAVRKGTGKGWDEWRDLLDRFPGRDQGHKTIAAHVQAAFDVSGWWAQTVTVGYERITGLRLPHQMADGTFTTNKSATITVDATTLRQLLLGDESRAELLPGLVTELRSAPTAKSIRLAADPGRVSISVEEQAGGRAKISVQHAQLPTSEDVERWKTFWADWITAIDGSTELS